jgi:polyisoprenoid-binding protein YceI
VLTAGALCTPTGAAEPARYAIDPDHQTVAFLVEHIGYARTLGRFLDVTGAYTFDEASGTVSDVRITIDTASVSTQHDKRDEHLRGKDFLDVKAYPQMVFTADRAVPGCPPPKPNAGELEQLG